MGNADISNEGGIPSSLGSPLDLDVGDRPIAITNRGDGSFVMATFNESTALSGNGNHIPIISYAHWVDSGVG